MPADDLVTVRGQAVSSKSCTLMAMDQPWLFQSIDWDEKLEPQKLKQANAVAADGRTLGEYDSNLKISFSKEQALLFKKTAYNLALAANLGGYGEYEFPIVLSYVKKDGTESKVEFDLARIMGPSVSAGNDANPLVENIDFSIMSLSEDGMKITNLRR